MSGEKTALKFSKDMNFHKILIGKKVSYNSIRIGKVNDVKIENDRIIITAKINKKWRKIIAEELSCNSCTKIIADLGIELMNI